MRIFNFLLVSDAVGGLGPPDGLVEMHPEYTTYALIGLISICIITGGILFYFHLKSKNSKGDE